MPDDESLTSDAARGPRPLHISAHDESLTSDVATVRLSFARSMHDESLTSDFVKGPAALRISVHDESLTSDVVTAVQVLTAQTPERLESLRQTLTGAQSAEPSRQDVVEALSNEVPELASFWARLIHSPEAVAAWLAVLIAIISILLLHFDQTATVQQTTTIVNEQRITEIVIAPQASTPRVEQQNTQPDQPRH
jgi:hypothetical protein